LQRQVLRVLFGEGVVWLEGAQVEKVKVEEVKMMRRGVECYRRGAKSMRGVVWKVQEGIVRVKLLGESDCAPLLTKARWLLTRRRGLVLRTTRRGAHCRIPAETKLCDRRRKKSCCALGLVVTVARRVRRKIAGEMAGGRGGAAD